MRRRSLKTSFFILLVFSSTLVHAESSNTQSAPHYLRGVLHVHSIFSRDSIATFNQISDAAKSNSLDYVILTDHDNLKARALSFPRKRESNLDPPVKPGDDMSTPLLIFGSEITMSPGHLLVFGIDRMPSNPKNLQKSLDEIHEQGGFAIVAHPYHRIRKLSWKNWNVKGIDGVEIYNGSSSSKIDSNKHFSPRLGIAAFWSYLYPLKTRHHLNVWQEQLQKGRMSAFAGIDTHIHAVKNRENEIAQFNNFFHYAVVYVKADRLEEKSIIEAFKKGRSFIVFEKRGRGDGFSFTTQQGNENYEMGDEIASSHVLLTFKVHVPQTAEIRLLYNGRVVKKTNGTELDYSSDLTGNYRLEVYREGKPWIFSNPIYVTSERSS
jgi:hypothetical protein